MEMATKFKILLFISLLLMNKTTHSKECQSWLKNDILKYSFGIISSEYNVVEKTYEPSKYIVNIDLDSTQMECIRSFSYDDWISLLNDSSTNV